jgi:hypothetical protein
VNGGGGGGGDDIGFRIEDSARFTGFQYVDWVFDRQERNTIHYDVRTGYRGADSFHNANRLTVNTIEDTSSVCTWTGRFESLGNLGNMCPNVLAIA